MTSVLVTGGAGYIGSHTCKALAASGITPVCYDNLSTGNRWAVRWGPFESGDISDLVRLKEVITSHEPEAVIHFAASAYVGESVSNPSKYYRNNVVGTLCLLEALRHTGINRLVFSSTCAIYGAPQQVPISETEPQCPVNPYGRSKMMIEQILADYADAYGLNAVALRYFNAAGADPDNEIGEVHDPETHLIPLVLEAALDNKRPVTVLGTDYPTSDGTCIRDYIHVSDLAEAHVKALEYSGRQAGYSIFNLGTGTGHSVSQVIDTVERCTNRKVAFKQGQRRPGDPPELVALPDKARDELGWQAEQSGIENIIRTAWNWANR